MFENYMIFISAIPDRDGDYCALCMEFPSLSAFGDTPEKAIETMKDLIKHQIDWYHEDGHFLPEPYFL